MLNVTHCSSKRRVGQIFCHYHREVRHLMKVLIAPDSYKGCLSAIEVAEAIERGVLAAVPDAQVDKVPMADGGEGTVDALLVAIGGKKVPVRVLDPLGREVESFYGVTTDGVALIEMAAASGLPMLDKDERDPLHTTTYGTGQLIRAALEAGCRHIIIGIGGSATNDGGMGMAQALGAVFRDKDGAIIERGDGESTGLVCDIDVSGMMPELSDCVIDVACDVSNPLCGATGASAVFGPQKGATPELIAQLDANLAHYARVINACLSRDVAQIPGAGAAGGLGAGLMAFTNAKLRPGCDIVIEAARLAERIAQCDLVFTGEGQTDFQTIYGKVPAGIGTVAKSVGVPVVCLSGAVRHGFEEIYECGVTAALSITTRPMTLAESIKRAPVLLERNARAITRLVAFKREK